MSPTTIRKLSKKNRYRVKNQGKITAKETTKRKAIRQQKLLRGIEHGMIPR